MDRVGDGRLLDMTSANDECPSFGVETMDGGIARIWVGHPDEEVRAASGCAERYAVTWQREQGDTPEQDYAAPTVREALAVLDFLVESHGGPRRRMRLLGEQAWR